MNNKKREIIIKNLKEKTDIIFEKYEHPMNVTMNLISLATYFFTIEAVQNGLDVEEIHSLLKQPIENAMNQLMRNLDKSKEVENE